MMLLALFHIYVYFSLQDCLLRDRTDAASHMYTHTNIYFLCGDEIRFTFGGRGKVNMPPHPLTLTNHRTKLLPVLVLLVVFSNIKPPH